MLGDQTDRRVGGGKRFARTVNPPPPENVATAFAHSSDSFRRSIALGWHSIPLGDTGETLVASRWAI